MVSAGESIMQSGQLARALKRVSMQVIEDLKGNKDLLVLGLNSRGYHVAKIISGHIAASLNAQIVCLPLEVIDESSSTDEWKRQLAAHSAVLLVDDVLFSGSTMMKAVRMVLDHGNPSILRVAVVIDRGHRKYPVQPDFVGLVSPTKFLEHVEVAFNEHNIPENVVLTGR
jgi:pyrimidine operon attenuation protein/uracil phosphoribosyltransferase